MRMIAGVPVDEALWAALGRIYDCAVEMDNLSRPRNVQDTTDEWLAIFYSLVESSLYVTGRLGDQTDLYPRRINTAMFTQARVSHCLRGEE